MSTNTYTLVLRSTSTIAYDADTGSRIGCFDRTAGASRGTIGPRVVAATYDAWIKALDAR